MISFLHSLFPFLKPKAQEDGSFAPSSFSRMLAVPKKTDYKKAFEGKKTESKVLILCTEENHFEMTNGKKFSTGNHPVELFVPLLHLKDIGANYDYVTLTGKPVAIEEWAYPVNDETVMKVIREEKEKLSAPLTIEEAFEKKEQYDGIFVPGGHGAMLGISDDARVEKLLGSFQSDDKFIFSLCHGPAALLNFKDQIAGYKLSAFPDFMDKFTPYIGYLPGKMPWFLGERLKSYGAQVKFSTASGQCHQDRNFITGDSPNAAQEFGKRMANALLNS